MATIPGTSAGETLPGTSGNDSIFGEGGNDSLPGGNGDDLLDGGTGADTMVGGNGSDTYIVDNTGDRIIEAVGSGRGPGPGTQDTVGRFDTVRSSINFIIPSDVGIETVVLTGTANLRATGSTRDETLVGNSGNNTMSGSGGNDSLSGREGNDILHGDEGNDSLSGGAGSDQLRGGAGNDVYSSIDNNGDDSWVDVSNSSNEHYSISESSGTITITDFGGSDRMRFFVRNGVSLNDAANNALLGRRLGNDLEIRNTAGNTARVIIKDHFAVNAVGNLANRIETFEVTNANGDILAATVQITQVVVPPRSSTSLRTSSASAALHGSVQNLVNQMAAFRQAAAGASAAGGLPAAEPAPLLLAAQ